MKNIVLALFASSLFGSQFALARDSQHLVCGGSLKIQDASGVTEELPVAVYVLESRGPDGVTRDERLSAIVGHEFYRGAVANIADDSNSDRKTALTSPEDYALILFNGNYWFSGNRKALHLRGFGTLTPAELESEYLPTTAALKCQDISI